MKVVINTRYGGFSISVKAKELYFKGKNISRYELPRSDPRLIQAVEELGEEANGEYAALKIIDIPNGVKYTIDEYDGMESIHEKHRSWS